MKLATKILLTLVGGIVAAVAALILIAGTRTEKMLEGQLVARLEDNANHMLDKINQYLYGHLLGIRSLSADPAFLAATASPEQTTGHLREFLRWHQDLASAAFYTMDWVVVADTAGRRAGGPEALLDCRANLAAGKDTAVCAGRDSPGDEPTLRLAVVMRDERAARGVVVLRLPLQVLGDKLREVSGFRGSSGHLYVDLVDRNGVFLYSNYEREGILREVSPDWAFVQEGLLAGRTIGSRRFNNPAEQIGEEILAYVRQRGFQSYEGSEWTLILFMPTAEVFAPVRMLRLGNIAAVLVTNTVLLMIILLLVRSFTRPIEKLAQAAREIGRGNLEARVPVGSSDELGLFAETFNRMATDVQESQLEVVAAKRELEGLVDGRTAELLATNELLHIELSEHVKTQEKLAAQERLLRLSADIGEALTFGLTLEAALQLCAEFIVKDLEAAFVRIWTLGSEAGVLELKASAGLYTRLDGQHRRKVFGEQKIGIIAQTQRPVITNTVIGDPAITDQDWARREGMAAFAGHPLVVQGRCVGVMALFSRRCLEPSVLAALSTVADKIAAVIGHRISEESLRISEQRYRELFESSRDGIFTTNAAGIFINLNPAGARIFGHATPADLIGRSALEYWRDPADRNVFYETLLREKSISAYPIRAKKKDGSSLELEGSCRVREDENGVFLGIEAVLRDVTQRVRAEGERELLIAELQEAAANIRTLSGLLPICAGCKKIRDQKGRWDPIETYLSAHSEAEFTHGLCPDCIKAYYPGIPGIDPGGKK